MERNKLNQQEHSKLQDNVEKLNKLGCTLLGSRDEAWIMKLFFKPGLHRCQLMEWILSKLTDNATKIAGSQDSAEDKMKYLQATISDWGLCRENCKSIIEGSAAVKDQLEFWSSLIDIVWVKHEINSYVLIEDSGMETTAVPENEKRNKISEEFDATCSALNQYSESGDVKHLFKDKLQLLDPDIEEEIAAFSSNSKVFKDPNCVILKEPTERNVPASKILKNLCLNEILVDQPDSFDSEEELNRLEEELNKVSNEFLCSAKNLFNNVYNDLKPLILNAKAYEFEDAGPDFQNAEPLLKDVLELEKSFDKLQFSNSKLLEINSDVEDILNDEAISDENYAKTFKLLNDDS